MREPRITAPAVIICGGGPVGLALAVELGTRGVSCVVVEPRLEPTRSRPRAKTLNTRTMEHFRRWGLAERLRERAPLPASWSSDVSFCTTLLGEEITRFTGVLGLGDDGVSPELGQQLPQYVLEDFLREVVEELPSVQLWLGARVVGVGPDEGEDGTAVRVLTGSGETRDLQAQFVVGADGGRSTVREQIGARYVGSQALRPNTGVVFRSAELSRLLPHEAAVQTWLLNHQTPGMMGPVDRDGLWWLIAFGVDGTAPSLDPQALIDGAIGQHLPVEVISTDPWTARMELVDRARRGCVFLIGDAAHLNPPFGGHGLNTGIGDAADLGWKIAATLDGWAGPALLDSYEIERRPLHRRVIDEAAANMATLAPELLSQDLDRPGPVGRGARRRAADRIRATKRAEYFSLDLVLGHRYQHSPIIVEAEDPAGPWATRAAPGRRLPHLWVTPGVSTLDLVGAGHTLLVGTAAEPDLLRSAAARAGWPLALSLLDDTLMEQLGHTSILVRPDQVVAACDDLRPESILSALTGADHRARQRRCS